MTKSVMINLIARMHIRLNILIEKNGFNLQSNEVLHYSRRLDRVLSHYNRIMGKGKESYLNEDIMEYLIR